MIDDENRYICLGGDSQQPGGPTTWHITDWDRRRVVSVTMDGEHDDESLFLEHFPRHSDQLSPGTYRIYLSPTGDLISTHSDPDDDPTYFVHYPLLSEISLPEGVQTVRRSELEELDRFGPDVDLVTYPPLVADTVSPKKVPATRNQLMCVYFRITLTFLGRLSSNTISIGSSLPSPGRR